MNEVIVTQFIDSLPAAFEAGDAGAAGKMEEAGNVRRLQELYRAIARGDLPGAVAMMTEDIELQIFGPAQFNFTRRAFGPALTLAALQTNFAQMEDQRPELVSLVAQGNAVVVIFRERGRYRPTGKAYDLHCIQLFEFRDGRVARYRGFGDLWSPVEALP